MEFASSRSIMESAEAPLLRTVSKKVFDKKKATLEYIDSIFPSCFNTEKTVFRMIKSIIDNHVVFALFFGASLPNRSIALLEVITLMNLLMFCIAIVTSVEIQFDDGTCAMFSTPRTCMQDVSIYDNGKTQCLWDSERNACYY